MNYYITRVLIGRMSKFVLLVVAFSMAVSTATAQVLVADYQFTSGSLASSATQPSVTTSNIGLNGVLKVLPTLDSATLNGNWAPTADGAGTYAYGLASELARNEADTLTANNSYQFTITPGALTEVSFSSLQFWGRRNSSNVGRTIYFLRSSLNSYATNLFEVNDPFSSDDTSVTWNLGSIGALQNVDEAVSFRLYVYTLGAGSDPLIHATAIDDIRLSATVIPEPSALALLGLALGAFLLARRRIMPLG